MSVIFLLIPLSVVVATGFLVAFIWAVRSGQYEDTCTPALRLLLNDNSPSPAAGQQSGCSKNDRRSASPTPASSGAHRRSTRAVESALPESNSNP